MATDPAAPEPAELPRATERLAVLALVWAAFVLNLNANVLGALLPFLRAELPLQDGDSEILVAGTAIGTGIGALVVGTVTQRLGRRATLQLGLVLFVVASALHAVPGGFWWLAGLRAASGGAAGLAYSTASALASRVTPYARRGATMGWFSAGMFLAIPVGMPLTVALARAGWWQVIFAAQAAIGLLAIVLAARAVPAVADDERAARFRDVLGDGQVRAGLIATLLHVGSFLTVVQLATVWLDETGRVPRADQIYLWIALGLLSVIGSAGLGRLSDRVGKRAFVLTCSGILVVCFLVLAREPGPLAMLGVGLVLALTAAARTGPLQALLSGLVPESRLSALMGLRTASMQLGVVLFALIARELAPRLGFAGVLFFAAVCQVGSYAAIRFGVRRS
ncbi:MAG: MFS transporter [bacterium]|nr:MFS transporter [bacterium]